MKIKRGKMDIILNILCLIILICLIVFLIVIWPEIPDKVPMHSDFAGNTDRWGSKSELIVLPVIAWILYILMTVVEKIPQLWNTGVKITEENKERVYAVLLHLVSSMKFIIVCIFAYLTVQTAVGFKLSPWFTPAYLLIIFGDLSYWIWRTFKVK